MERLAISKKIFLKIKKSAQEMKKYARKIKKSNRSKIWLKEIMN